MPALNWLTRDDDRPSASKAPCRLLEEVPDRAAGQRDTGNRLIQGDNLEALKSLLPFQAGQGKGGFGDARPATHARPSAMTMTEHTQWLGMMSPRLEVLRDRLAEDGSS